MQEDQSQHQDQSQPQGSDSQAQDILPMEQDQPQSVAHEPETSHETETAAPLEEKPAEPAEQSAPEQPATPAEQPPADSAVEGQRKKILLVEDNVALAAVYRSRFELEDFELYEVNDGDHALQAAKEFKPDLILLDAMMPKISGFDVLDILRHTPETANIRVVMLTALSQPKDKERAESLGVDDYLVKSQVVIGDVVERVKHHLNMK